MNDKKHLVLVMSFLATLISPAFGVNALAKEHAPAEEVCNDVSECLAKAKDLIDKNDYEGALPYNESGCRHDDANSCFLLGLQYETGRGTVQDYGMAESYHEKSCNMNYAPACINIGYMYTQGNGVSRVNNRLIKSINSL